jgi:hypothetical protein
MNLINSFLHRKLTILMRTILRIYYKESYRIYANRWHPQHAMFQEALEETVQYIKAHMPDAMIRADAPEVLSYASRQVKIDGLFMEFGVRSGRTINHIAKLNPDRTIYGFDSFEGLPEDWTGFVQDQGTFGGEGVPWVEKNVELVIGWFDETLPRFVEENSGDLAFAHVDSDLYSSAKTILDQLAPRIKAGTVIVFNEYFNYPNWKEHEYKAFQEFCDRYSVKYDYLCWGMYEVAVRIRSIKKVD